MEASLIPYQRLHYLTAIVTATVLGHLKVANPPANYKAANHLSYWGTSGRTTEPFASQLNRQRGTFLSLSPGPTLPTPTFLLRGPGKNNLLGTVTVLQEQPLSWGGRQRGGFALELSNLEPRGVNSE